MEHLLPLPYSPDSLEPFIDKQTMIIHHDKHHQTYVDKFNLALEKHPELKNKNAEELIKDLTKVPEDIRETIRNNGGGAVNHTFFWQLLKKDMPMEGEVIKQIEKDFGNFSDFKKQFSEKAISLFGSGWCWLVDNKGKLEIMQTAGHDNPISQGKKPILVIDVWEHAYYLSYQNRRADYVDAFFNIINWEQVNKNFINN